MIADDFPLVLISVGSLLWAKGFSSGLDRYDGTVQLEGIY